LELSEKISKLIEDKGVSAYEVGIGSSVAHSSLSRMLSGETKKLSGKNKKALAKYFNVEEDYFNFGNKTEIIKEKKDSALVKANVDALFESDYFNNKLLTFLNEYMSEAKNYVEELKSMIVETEKKQKSS